MIDKELLEILACPACKAGVVLDIKNKEERLICSMCKRIYPVRDEIPIMLVDEEIRFDV